MELSQAAEINNQKAWQAYSRHCMLRRRSLLKQAGGGEDALKFELGKGKGNSFRERKEKVREKTNPKNRVKLQYCRHKLQKTFRAQLGQCPTSPTPTITTET
jgi:hypothetical protein